MRFTKFFPVAGLLALPLFASALVGGCVENHASVYIDRVLAPDAETLSPDEEFVSEGTWDKQFAFTAKILVGNQLTPLGDPDTLRPETSRFIIKGIEVHVLSGDMASELAAYTAVAAGTVSPSDSSEPGWGGVAAAILPANLAATGRVVSQFRVFGETLAGTTLETGDYAFPVNIVPRGTLAVGYDETGVCDEGAEIPADCPYCYSCAICDPNCFD